MCPCRAILPITQACSWKQTTVSSSFTRGDAAFHRNQFLGGEVPPGIAEFTKATQADDAQRRNSESLLAEVSTWSDVRIITAHSPD